MIFYYRGEMFGALVITNNYLPDILDYHDS